MENLAGPLNGTESMGRFLVSVSMSLSRLVGHSGGYGKGRKPKSDGRELAVLLPGLHAANRGQVPLVGMKIAGFYNKSFLNQHNRDLISNGIHNLLISTK